MTGIIALIMTSGLLQPAFEPPCLPGVPPWSVETRTGAAFPAVSAGPLLRHPRHTPLLGFRADRSVPCAPLGDAIEHTVIVVRPGDLCRDRSARKHLAGRHRNRTSCCAAMRGSVRHLL